jgi:hypothetical protein
MSAGKGDSPRRVNKKKFDENFDDIFGPRKPWWDKEEEERKCCNIDCGCKNKKNKKTP